MTPTVWTPAMVAVLHAHAYGRKTPAEVAAILGVTEAVVVCKIRLSYSSKIDPVVRDRLRQYAAKGWKPSRIAVQMGLPVALVEIHLTPADA